MRLFHRRITLIGLIAFSLLAFPLPGYADTLEAFKIRIESAFLAPEKPVAVQRLFYQQDLTQEMQVMLTRMVGHIIRRQQATVNFVPIPKEAQLVAVVDGYEYRPNLEVVGYADIGKNDMGGTTQVPYGLSPDGRYYFTATTKTLVNPHAKPDKQLQMVAIGMGHLHRMVRHFAERQQNHPQKA